LGQIAHLSRDNRDFTHHRQLVTCITWFGDGWMGAKESAILVLTTVSHQISWQVTKVMRPEIVPSALEYGNSHLPEMGCRRAAPRIIEYELWALNPCQRSRFAR